MRKLNLVLVTILFTTFGSYGQKINEKLYKAVVKGDTSLVRQLLNEKADPNFIKSEGPWMKVNMLITAVNNNNLDIAKLLIANKANIKWKDGFNTTALMYAAAKGNKEMVVLLLDNGADINDDDGSGNTVLSAAKEGKNKELIQFVKDKLKEKK